MEKDGGDDDSTLDFWNWEANQSYTPDFYDYADYVGSECRHEWKTYLGIIEIHEYCANCDKVRNRRKGGYLDDPIPDEEED